MSLCYACSDEGLTLETSAKGDKHTISTFVELIPYSAYSPTQKNSFFKKTSLPERMLADSVLRSSSGL